MSLLHILKAKEQNGAKIIVCDPRFTRTAAHANEYVRLRPGTDVALVWGLLWHIFENGWEDKRFIRERVYAMDDVRAEVAKWTPDEVERVGVKALYFAYFFKWSMFENYQYIKDKMDFRTAPAGRTDGTFTDFDSLDDKIDNLYYYMQFIKFGFGRATRDASRMIQNGHLGRAEGLELVRKHDDEFPATFFDENLDYLGLSAPEFTETVDLHRNSEIWEFAGNRWQLRFPPE